MFPYKNHYFFIALLVLLCCLQSCIEPFEPTLEGAEDTLVVDGMITDAPGPYTVKLSLSFDPYAPVTLPVTGAKVTIIEENGVEEILTEEVPGTYQTATNGIQGQVGKSYKVKIETTDGSVYESPFQTIQASVPIEKVEPALEYRFFETAGKDVPGYQFYLTSAPAADSESYFMWLQEGTFKYTARYPLTYIYNNGPIDVDDPFEFMVCYKDDLIQEVHTYSTLNVAGNKIENIPLTFVRADIRQLSNRYSLLVRQFALSKTAYDYWRNVEGQFANLGSLYTVQPFQIRGNIKNTADEEEVVLGYFTVAGESNLRIFVDPPPGNFYEMVCELDPETYFRMVRFPSSWPANVYVETGLGQFVFSNGCIDCRRVGGDIVKPDFWE